MIYRRGTAMGGRRQKQNEKKRKRTEGRNRRESQSSTRETEGNGGRSWPLWAKASRQEEGGREERWEAERGDLKGTRKLYMIISSPFHISSFIFHSIVSCRILLSVFLILFIFSLIDIFTIWQLHCALHSSLHYFEQLGFSVSFGDSSLQQNNLSGECKVTDERAWTRRVWNRKYKEKKTGKSYNLRCKNNV